MFIISLYHTDLIFLTHKLIGKIKSIILKNSERLALERRFRHGLSHYFQMRCRAVLLKLTGLPASR